MLLILVRRVPWRWRSGFANGSRSTSSGCRGADRPPDRLRRNCDTTRRRIDSRWVGSAADAAMYHVKALGKNGIQSARDRSDSSPARFYPGVSRLSLRSMLSLFSSDLAIDLVRQHVRLCARKGDRRQRALHCGDQQGQRARRSGWSRGEGDARPHAGNIVAIKPMKDGVIADFEVTEKMLTYHQEGAQPERVGPAANRDRRAVRRSRRSRSAPSRTARIAPRPAKCTWSRKRWPRRSARGCHHRTVRQHDSGHRRRHDGHRGHLARRHRLQQGGARRRQRDGRGDHPASRRPTTCSSANAPRSRSRWKSARRFRSKKR